MIHYFRTGAANSSLNPLFTQERPKGVPNGITPITVGNAADVIVATAGSASGSTLYLRNMSTAGQIIKFSSNTGSPATAPAFTLFPGESIILQNVTGSVLARADAAGAIVESGSSQ